MGCQSREAALSAKGRVRSELIGGMMSRPWGTAREPVWIKLNGDCMGGYGWTKVVLHVYD